MIHEFPDIALFDLVLGILTFSLYLALIIFVPLAIAAYILDGISMRRQLQTEHRYNKLRQEFKKQHGELDG